MSTSQIDQAIRARVEAFAAELTELVRAAALESVRDALGERTPARPTRRLARSGRPRKASTPRARRKAGKRVRRSADDVQALAERVHAAILEKAGQGLSAIAAGLGEAVKDVRRPLQLLLDAGKVRMEGVRRGATYHPAGRGGAAKPATRKGGRKKTARKARKITGDAAR